MLHHRLVTTRNCILSKFRRNGKANQYQASHSWNVPEKHQAEYKSSSSSFIISEVRSKQQPTQVFQKRNLQHQQCSTYSSVRNSTLKSASYNRDHSSSKNPSSTHHSTQQHQIYIITLQNSTYQYSTG